MEEDVGEKHLVRVNSVQQTDLKWFVLVFKIFSCRKYT